MKMIIEYKITEQEAQEIRQRMTKTKKANIYKRMEAVALRGEGKSNVEISKITKYHPKRVSQLVSLFVNEGLEKLASDGRKGGNHKNLSNEQEKDLLDSFEDEATAGKIITPAEIKKKYDTVLGRETKPTFIYAVLKRHGWRMVMPRSKHPNKASEEQKP
jgi:transposase